jgi:Asp-tRNA(Asn)/Glu-tRNA(Gln) amidotransferase A subunit family amidase
MTALNELPLHQAAALTVTRQVKAEELVEACIARIEAREPTVRAFEVFDPDHARAQAKALDAGPVRGPLHGIPLGIKDIIDTADMATGWGSPIYAGHRPVRDAACVALCRAAGAVILGKTVTTEFAYFHPGKTVNPHNPAHTPGGSSMGSAAAVADFMVPFAFGSQTAGSVIRPAAYCGTVGYKASHGEFPLDGVCGLCSSLDTLGFFVRHPRDLAYFRAALLGDQGAPALSRPPRVGFYRTPHWDQADPATRALLDSTAMLLSERGAQVADATLGPAFDGLSEAQKTVMAFETARSRAHEYRTQPDQMSAPMRKLMEAGRVIPYDAYRQARRLAADGRQALAEVFSRFDVLLAPSAPGEAPEGLSATGDPLFNRMWTLLHVPCITLPIGEGPKGLPLGVQLIGAYGEDSKLIAGAAWAWDRLGTSSA